MKVKLLEKRKAEGVTKEEKGQKRTKREKIKEKIMERDLLSE